MASVDSTSSTSAQAQDKGIGQAIQHTLTGLPTPESTPEPDEARIRDAEQRRQQPAGPSALNNNGPSQVGQQQDSAAPLGSGSGTTNKENWSIADDGSPLTDEEKRFLDKLHTAENATDFIGLDAEKRKDEKLVKKAFEKHLKIAGKKEIAWKRRLTLTHTRQY